MNAGITVQYESEQKRNRFPILSKNQIFILSESQLPASAAGCQFVLKNQPLSSLRHLYESLMKILHAF